MGNSNSDQGVPEPKKRKFNWTALSVLIALLGIPLGLYQLSEQSRLAREQQRFNALSAVLDDLRGSEDPLGRAAAASNLGFYLGEERFVDLIWPALVNQHRVEGDWRVLDSLRAALSQAHRKLGETAGAGEQRKLALELRTVQRSLRQEIIDSRQGRRDETRGKQRAYLATALALSQLERIPIDLTGAPLDGADLSRLDLRGARLHNARLKGADLRGVPLVEADLSDADLRDARLDGANLKNANLYSTDLASATLAKVNLQGASLLRATLPGADLSNAGLMEALLAEADLRGANFRQSVLWAADFTGARLDGALLGNAFTNHCTNFENATGLDPGATLPLGCEEKRGREIVIGVRRHTEAAGFREAARHYRDNVNPEVLIREFNSYQRLFYEVTHNGENLDVVLIDDPWVPYLADSGELMELTPVLRGHEALWKQLGDDFYANSVDLGRWPPGSEEIYAVPILGNVTVMFASEPRLRAAGLSSDFEELGDLVPAASRLTSPEQQRYGFAIRGSGSEIVVSFLPFFWHYGGRLFSDEAMCSSQLFTHKTVRALEFYRELARYGPPEARSFDDIKAIQTLLDGTSAITIEMAAFASLVESRQGARRTIGYRALPESSEGRVPLLGHWLLAIPARQLADLSSAGERLQAAIDFIVWAIGPQGMRIAAQAGMLPVRKSLLSDSALEERFPVYKVLRESIPRAQARPRVPEWTRINEIFGNAVTRVVSGEQSSWMAMLEAQEQIEALRAQSPACPPAAAPAGSEGGQGPQR